MGGAPSRPVTAACPPPPPPPPYIYPPFPSCVLISPDCTFIAIWENEAADGPPRFNCPLCKKSRCLQCNATPYHEGLRCPPAAVAGGGGGGGGGGDPAFERRAQEEAATSAYLASKESGVKPCPACKTPISQTFGCFKMKCVACGHRFCYACGTKEAACHCTPIGHGFWDNKVNRGDFANLQLPAGPPGPPPLPPAPPSYPPAPPPLPHALWASPFARVFRR